MLVSTHYRKLSKQCCGVLFMILMSVLVGMNQLGAQEADADTATVAVSNTNTSAVSEDEQKVVWGGQGDSISKYLRKLASVPRPDTQIDLPVTQYTASGDAQLAVLPELAGKNSVLSWTGEEGWVEWEFTAPADGVYNLGMVYYPLAAKSLSVQLGIQIDGEYPYADARSVEFARIWKDETAIRKDDLGNDLKPYQVEAPAWERRDFIDTQGFYNKSLPFLITKGKHVLRLNLIREAIAIHELYFYNSKEAPRAEELQAEYNSKGYKASSGQFIKVQAENTYRKSDSALLPTYDRSSVATEPSHASKIRLNTLGGQWTWKLPGSWAEWQVEVPESGLYKFYIKARQNFQSGMLATRKVFVDGKIPSQDFENFEMPYDMFWDVYTPGSAENPALVYLEKGSHIIRMETSIGRIAPVLTAVEDLIYELNYIRRRFLMIMGSDPDIYRDYQLDKEMPGLVDHLLVLSERFSQENEEFERITGQKNSEASSSLRSMARLLREFANKPEDIPARQQAFFGQVTALASWGLYRKELPIEMDYLVLASPDVKAPSAGADFFSQTAYDIKAFFSSFVEDYNNIGKTDSQAITVWYSGGRDQANIIRDLINDSFTPSTGIKVNLSLVQAGIIEATLAGKGPEVLLSYSRGGPVNLAARGALYDLSKFPDFDEVSKRFQTTALVPYRYNGGVWALPLQQNFHMMFYRTDIFNELNIKPPQTWDELLSVIPILQQNNMQVGLPYPATDDAALIDAGIGSRYLFPTLLLQMGGNFYKNNDRETGLMDSVAYTAFKTWTDFYVKYGFPVKYDFFTRFRTGETPLAIAPYTEYNRLVIAAPEIRNLWEMVPIPGTLKADGSLDRREAASGSSSIMFSGIKNPEAGWEFLKWWTSSDIQYKYAMQVETVMGPAARLDTANIETFKRLPWSKTVAEKILKQWDSIDEVKEIPGGYYTIRMVDTAFSRIIYDNWNVRWSLQYFSRMINEELERKRKELGANE